MSRKFTTMTSESTIRLQNAALIQSGFQGLKCNSANSSGAPMTS